MREAMYRKRLTIDVYGLGEGLPAPAEALGAEGLLLHLNVGVLLADELRNLHAPNDAS